MSVDETTVREKVVDWWLGRAGIDILIAVIAIVVHWWVWHEGWVEWSLGEVAPSQRALIYAGLATVAALAAGTNNTAVGSYVSSSGEVVAKLRVSHGATLRQGLRSIGSWLWAVTVFALVCLALDPLDAKRPVTSHGAVWLAEGMLVLIALKFFRLTLLQDVVLAANDLSAQRASKPTRRNFKPPSRTPGV